MGEGGSYRFTQVAGERCINDGAHIWHRLGAIAPLNHLGEKPPLVPRWRRMGTRSARLFKGYENLAGKRAEVKAPLGGALFCCDWK